MTNMNLNNTATAAVTAEAARAAALRDPGVISAELGRCARADGVWELGFDSNELRYDCYVDAESGEVLGVDFRPVPVEAYPEYAKQFYSFRRARAAA